MKLDEYIMTIDTDKKFDDPNLACALMADWLERMDPALRAERYGYSEPVRRHIAETTVAELAEAWLVRSMMFTRKTKPKMTISFNWRKEKGLDPRPFPWGGVLWLAKNAKDDLAIDYFDFFLRHFDPGFAYVTTQADSTQKHFMKLPHYHAVTKERIGTSQSFKGHHVLKTIPGIYWQNFFGPALIERLGRDRLLTCPVGRVRELPNGILVSAYENSALIGTDEGLALEEQIKDHLGRAHFFDKAAFILEAEKPRFH